MESHSRLLLVGNRCLAAGGNATESRTHAAIN
jgi:hypothetical protein